MGPTREEGIPEEQGTGHLLRAPAQAGYQLWEVLSVQSTHACLTTSTPPALSYKYMGARGTLIQEPGRDGGQGHPRVLRIQTDQLMG